MSNPQHPYPDHVRDAVADAIESLFMEADTWEKIDAAHDNLADTALQALWDASRVETIDDIHDVPESAVVRDKTGFVAVGREHAESDIDYDDYPAHVIYWGDHDE